MSKSRKHFWEMIGISCLSILTGAIGIWYGIERLDTAVLKFRQVGKIAGGVLVVAVGFYLLVYQFRSSGKKA